MTWVHELGKEGDELHGWYVRLSGGDFDPDELRFRNYGNGPEVFYPDDVFGPFPTEARARMFVRENRH